jgi:hypothetical protein
MDARENFAAHATGRDGRVIGSNLPDDLSQQGFPVIFPCVPDAGGRDVTRTRVAKHDRTVSASASHTKGAYHRAYGYERCSE